MGTGHSQHHQPVIVLGDDSQYLIDLLPFHIFLVGCSHTDVRFMWNSVLDSTPQGNVDPVIPSCYDENNTTLPVSPRYVFFGADGSQKLHVGKDQPLHKK